MNAGSGRAITGIEHIQQSIGDILTTPVGSRLMRREYGSLLPELIDQPDTPANRLRVIAASATAIMTWEPRVRPTKITIARAAGAGGIVISIDATNAENAPLSLSVALNGGA